MSEFLGWIHFWLYNKILLSERMEEQLVQWATAHRLPADQWRQQGIEQYGAPTGGAPLESIIDQTNIHGWLQSRITSAELRQAALVTAILDSQPDLKGALIELYNQQGKAASSSYEGQPTTPEELYKAVNDSVLEGMPCDRVDELISSDEKELIWRTTACLHEPYWDQVKGDVQHFYDLREAWIKSFVEGLNPKFTYVKSGNVHKIMKK